MKVVFFLSGTYYVSDFSGQPQSYEMPARKITTDTGSHLVVVDAHTTTTQSRGLSEPRPRWDSNPLVSQAC